MDWAYDDIERQEKSIDGSELDSDALLTQKILRSRVSREIL